jgi:hypothetical protein
MAAMIKEDRYIVYIGDKKHVLHVQELLWGMGPWPERFRAQIPPSAKRKEVTVYRCTEREVAERVMEHLRQLPGARNELSRAEAC